MYTGNNVPSSSRTIGTQPLVNGREVLDPNKGATRRVEQQLQQRSQQLANKVNNVGGSIVQTTTTVTPVPVPAGSLLGANVSVTTTQQDAMGNKHSTLISNTTIQPVPSFVNPYGPGIVAQPIAVGNLGRGPQPTGHHSGVVPQMNRGNAGALPTYSHPLLYKQ
jgi:hypothetical protein